MLPDAPAIAADSAAPRGTADSFRQLTARLKRVAPPPVPVATEPVPPGPVAVADGHPPPAPPPAPGEAAADLLDIIWGAVDLPPQERSMAGDTLLLLLPRLTLRELAMLAERIAVMDQPPPLLVSRLLHDPRPEVGGVILERSAQLGTGELIDACSASEPDRLRLLARRRSVPPALSDHLVQCGDLLSLLVLLRNPGAEISFASFLRLSGMAGEHAGLQAPLALRSDLPFAVAMDLLWRLPTELRRVVLARFLSDSTTLGRIASIALVAGDMPALAEGALPAGEVEAALGPLFAGRRDVAVAHLARLTGLAAATLERILDDGQGEAIVVLLKALGLGRSRFADLLDRLRAATGLIAEARPQEELKAVFDSLSATKARVLLIYWDWFSRRQGPYADAPGLVEAAPVA